MRVRLYAVHAPWVHVCSIINWSIAYSSGIPNVGTPRGSQGHKNGVAEANVRIKINFCSIGERESLKIIMIKEVLGDAESSVPRHGAEPPRVKKGWETML